MCAFFLTALMATTVFGQGQMLLETNQFTMPPWVESNSNAPGGIKVEDTSQGSADITGLLRGIEEVNEDQGKRLKFVGLFYRGEQQTSTTNLFYICQVTDRDSGEQQMWNIEVNQSGWDYSLQAAGQLAVKGNDGPNDGKFQYELPDWTSGIDDEPMPGGISVSADVNGVPQQATLAVELLNQKIDETFFVSKVRYMGSQVVAGTNYYFVVLLKRDDGSEEAWDLQLYVDLQGKAALSSAKSLKKKEGGHDEDTAAFTKPDWVFSDQGHSKGQTITGGISILENPESIREDAVLALQVLNRRERSKYSLKRIHHAGTQVVAGTNVFMVVEVNDEGSSSSEFWNIVMYVDIQGNISLTTAEKL